MTPEKTVERLSLYRRLLHDMESASIPSVYSHELAAKAGVTPAQLRRDLMPIGHMGSPTKGYAVRPLADAIGAFLDPPEPEGVALVGVGNLGRAILAFFAGRRPKLTITVAFDSDPDKAGRIIHGCRCHSTDEIPQRIPELGIRVAILTIPAPAAQPVADALCRAGVCGLLNFAPVPLRVGPGVYVEDIDMTTSLEKVAFFARQNTARKDAMK